MRRASRTQERRNTSRRRLRLAGALAALAAPMLLMPPAWGVNAPHTSPIAGAGTAAGGTAADGSTCASPVSGQTVFADGFEGTAPQFGFHGIGIDGSGSITAQTDPVLEGRQSAAFTVPDDGSSYRAELGMSPLGYGSFRFRFADFLPSDWTEADNDTILAQWHGADLASTGKPTNPPIALSIRDDGWLLTMHWLANPDDTTPQVKVIPLGPIRTGQWNDWTFDIDWSTPTEPGSVGACLNGVPLVTYTGTNNYDQQYAPHMQLGIYRPSWNPSTHGSYPTGGPPVRVFDDAVDVQELSP
ncbi:polysaccharide lyase [Streptomyces sp. NBC_00448]|uniref:polysaccharide lyase n=1 Tax=Streptomyces sp. NBC_00448 TaxID=2903652 RepID=UPI002E1ABE2F